MRLSGARGPLGNDFACNTVGAGMVFRRTRPLQAALFKPRVGDAVTGLPDSANFFPDVRGRMEIEELAFAHRARDVAHDLPIAPRLALWLDGLAHALDAALAVHERAVLLERRRGGQEDVAEFLRGLVHEKVLHDDEVEFLHRAPRGVHVRVRHHDVVADGPEHLQLPGAAASIMSIMLRPGCVGIGARANALNRAPSAMGT